MKTPEQEVAEILCLEVDPASAWRVLAEVPFWFHAFALNRAKRIYTPGVAVDHRYRLPFLPASFATLPAVPAQQRPRQLPAASRMGRPERSVTG